MQPVCFMVMPYGRKKTDAQPGQGPAEIDFDALWDRALRPAIVDLGYEPVRADQDVGALIIHEMLERLYFSDLVLAEMTIPNGNVYYEVGIRHACQPRGCVLVAADWSRPLFDVAQMRTVRYPLPGGEIDDAGAQPIRAALRAAVPPLAAGQSPMFELLHGYPQAVDASRASSVRRQLDALHAFQEKASRVRLAPKAERGARLRALMEECAAGPMSPAVVHTLLRLLEDSGAWDEILALVARLPEDRRRSADVLELQTLARSKTGDHVEAIAALQSLIDRDGPTAEREGLLGGRFKVLYESAIDPAEQRRWLDEAIAHYERGMWLDLNDFYPSSNLPRLYRDRGEPGDAERAVRVLGLVDLACERTLLREPSNPWVRPAQLGAAFDAGDPEAAEAVYRAIRKAGVEPWRLRSLCADLARSLRHVAGDDPRRALNDVLDRVATLA